MKRYLKLIGQFASYSMKAEMEFRLHTLSYFVFSFLWVGTTYLMTVLVFAQAGKIAGWSIQEALLLIFVYYVCSTLIKNFITPSMIQFIERVRKGELDFALTKPVDPQFLISIERMRVFTAARGVIMLGIVVFYIHKIGLHVTFAQGILTVFLAIMGMIGLYALFLFLATLSIWLENLWNLEDIFIESLEMSKHPVDIYPSLIRNTLIYILPVVGISAIPTMCLLGRLSPGLAISFSISSMVLFFLSRKFFFFALTQYRSASS